MNELFTLPPQRPTTQAAEGLPRWCWTVAEIERLAATGFFSEYDRFELLGGEIVPMSPKGAVMRSSGRNSHFDSQNWRRPAYLLLPSLNST